MVPDPVVKQITDKLYPEEQPTIDYEQRFMALRDWLMNTVGSASSLNSAKRVVERCLAGAIQFNRAQRALNAVEERLDWIERDRREPDKVLLSVASARRAIDDAREDLADL